MKHTQEFDFFDLYTWPKHNWKWRLLFCIAYPLWMMMIIPLFIITMVIAVILWLPIFICTGTNIFDE